MIRFFWWQNRWSLKVISEMSFGSQVTGTVCYFIVMQQLMEQTMH